MKKLALTVACSLALLACKKAKPEISPQYEGITQSVYASAQVQSREQYEVFTTIPGVIDKLNITEDDSVTAGQVLFTIRNNTAPLSKDISRLSANFNAADNNKDKLTQLRNAIDLARVKKDNDSTLLARQQVLWNQGIGAKIDLENRQLAAKNSATVYKNALLDYNVALKNIDYASKQSAGNLAISETTENDLAVKSLVKGVVLKVLKKPGEVATQQTPVAVIGGINDFYLELQVDEYDITQVKLGQTVIVGMDSYKNQTFEAVVTKIYPIMDAKSRAFTVEANFTKAPPTLYANLTAEANIVIAKKDKALLIPRNYLLNGDSVLLADGTKKAVKVGLKDYQKAEILSGLSTTDKLTLPQ